MSFDSININILKLGLSVRMISVDILLIVFYSAYGIITCEGEILYRIVPVHLHIL
jgi:hypothetical protein